jgi:hypothetical protein
MSWIDATPSGGSRNRADQVQVNTFLTPTSLITFSGASTAVIVVWRVLRKTITDAWEQEPLVPLLLPFAVGALIFVASDDEGRTWRERVVRIGVGIINCFLLAAAALGIGTVVGGRSATGG